MENSSLILDRIGAEKSMATRLRAVANGELAFFEHVTESAQPFVAALIARHAKANQRVWVVCKNIRAQEWFHDELLNWLPETNAIFFPEQEMAVSEAILPDAEIAAERLAALQALQPEKTESASSAKKTKSKSFGKKTSKKPLANQIIVVTKASLDQPVPTPEGLGEITLRLAKSATLDLAAFASKLDAAGYERVSQVALRGQYAVRGGIIDVFSWQHALPVRLELFGDEIDSIREFDLDAQTSVRQLEHCALILANGEVGNKSGRKKTDATTCALRDYFADDDLTIDADAGFEAARIQLLEGSAGVEASGEAEDFSTAFFGHTFDEWEAGDLIVAESKREQLFAQLRKWRDENWLTTIFCNNEGEAERLHDLIPEDVLRGSRLAIGAVMRGFTFPAAKIAVLSDAEIFGRYRNNRARRLALRRSREQTNRAQIDFSELNEDDLVVHLEHGIGRYLGLQNFVNGEDAEQEVLVIEFADEAKLYVPLEQSFLVSRYVGVGKSSPKLSALGDAKWARAKKNAEHAVFDYAANLLKIHAERETSKGFTFPPDTKWQQEFERSFLYKETPDQVTAIAAAKTDMESELPMDRLICGDVGFGKTEVAIRTAFKSVMSGKQVALLVPTTVLAQQHFQTFRERMSDYPISIEMLSRFRSPAEQRKTVAGMRDGSVDIVIGTHRLISKDVAFKNLGLVVIDEEQRFGVLHKERFKEMFQLVDVLTLSATPIPRTLYMALMGAKDMSTLETPPANRIPTETIICGYDERVIRDAIQREMRRGGQVYFLHNRVNSIERMAQRIKALCPKARVEIGHGQMDEDQLEGVMQRFVNSETDVLVSTTIIESGLDIPNANTIIIDRADRFGLADLYQLRGRVGRAQHKAYAYLLLPRDMMTVGAARKRINAIKQYSSLGAGFKIAMRDLEIRGAGNILGTQQSGHIIAIGFDLYCQLLKQAVTKMKGEKVRPRLDVPVAFDFVVMNEAEFAPFAISEPKMVISETELANDEDRTRRPQKTKSAQRISKIEKSKITKSPNQNHPLTPKRAPAFLPASYIADATMRIQAYRALAEIASQEQLHVLRKTWRDRFGELPAAVENLLVISEIKLSAAARKIAKVEVRDRKLMLTLGGDYVLLGGKFPRLHSAISNSLTVKSSSDPTASPLLNETLKLIQSF